MRFLPRSIAGRLTVWFLLISLLPTLALIAAMQVLVSRAVENVVAQNLALLLSVRTDQLKTFVEEREREVRYLARSPALRQGLERLEELPPTASPADREEILQSMRVPLEEFFATLQYPNVYFFDAEGRKEVQTAVGIDPGPELFRGPLAQTPLALGVKQCIAERKGRVTTLHDYGGENERGLAFFSIQPVIDRDRVRGAVVAQIATDELFAVLGDFAGLSETGEMYLSQVRDGQAYILSPLRNDSTGTYQNRGFPVDGEKASAAIAGARGATGNGLRTNYRGSRVVAGWEHLKILDLGVVVEMDTDDAFRWVHLIRWVNLALFLATGVLVVPAALLAARSLARPVTDASLVAQRVAAGDLTMQSDQRLASGEVGDLQLALQQMISQLRSLIGQVQHSIVTVMSASSQIAATARQQQQTVDDFGISTSEVAAAVNEISATSQELLHTIGEVTSSAQRSAELAATGQDALGGMQQTMNRLADSTGSISSRLSVISERANNINLVVTTITKVADQTNLLSINAAIEAEKAGEHGRGFIVVAREIRRLADQTASATLDIERIVKEMQQSVTAGVMEMDKFNEQVRQGVREVGTIGEQLHEIIRSVQDVSPMFVQVSDGMSAQSQGADQIREAMGQLRDGAARTATSLGEFQETTSLLRDAISRLQSDIARFQT